MAAPSGAATAITLPSGGGFSGSVDFSNVTGYIPGTTLTTTVTNVAPSGAPTLSNLLRQQLAVRKTLAANGAIVVLFYDIFLFNNAITFATPPGFVYTLPPLDVIPTAAYYLALYDPTRPSLGWQTGFEGPATVSGATLTFTAKDLTPFTFAANANYFVALYGISSSAATPTPAPSISPVAPATATPVPSESPTATPVPGGSSQPATPVPGGSSQPATPVPGGSSQP